MSAGLLLFVFALVSLPLPLPSLPPLRIADSAERVAARSIFLCPFGPTRDAS